MQTTLCCPHSACCLRVIVLDHHKTAIEMLTPSEAHCPNLDLQLDINRSGATIALDYFKPQVHTSIVLFAPHTDQPVAAQWVVMT